MFSIQGPKFKHFVLLMSVICIAAGVYLTFFHSAGFIKTNAVISSVNEEPGDFDSEETSHIVMVDYAVDGVQYTSKLDSYSPSHKVGKTIEVFYDPSDPNVVHSGNGMGIYAIAVGVALLVFAAVTSLKSKQAKEKIEKVTASRGGERYADSIKGAERELYFLTDTGTPKYGHRIEDKNRKILYEAKMTNFSLVTPYGFDFIDHEHGITTPHMIGHEESVEWNTFLIDNNYTFELDGEDIWKHLKSNGVSVETQRMKESIFPCYRVSRDGEEIAILESSSKFVHEEDAEQHSTMSKIAVPGFYRIWTREENLDLIFVTALAFARSGALNDEGGTYGKMIRSSIRN